MGLKNNWQKLGYWRIVLVKIDYRPKATVKCELCETLILISVINGEISENFYLSKLFHTKSTSNFFPNTKGIGL